MSFNQACCSVIQVSKPLKALKQWRSEYQYNRHDPKQMISNTAFHRLLQHSLDCLHHMKFKMADNLILQNVQKYSKAFEHFCKQKSHSMYPKAFI